MFYSFVCVIGYMVFVVFLDFEPYPCVTNISLGVILNLDHSYFFLRRHFNELEYGGGGEGRERRTKAGRQYFLTFSEG